MTLQPQRQILVVFPHPDDEAFSSAGTIRLYRNMGVPVTYACLTLGEWRVSKISAHFTKS